MDKGSGLSFVLVASGLESLCQTCLSKERAGGSGSNAHLLQAFPLIVTILHNIVEHSPSVLADGLGKELNEPCNWPYASN